MQDIDVQKVLELLPRAFEIYREKTWELIQRHPEIVGLRAPVPPEVDRLLKRQMRDLKELRKLRQTAPQPEGSLSTTSYYKKRPRPPRKVCSVCKIVHEGKLPRDHFVRAQRRMAANCKWRATTPEAKQANISKMIGQRIANNYRRAIERRVNILHPVFVSKIGHKAAYHFVEKGVEQHGWDFLIFHPKALIRQLTVGPNAPDLLKMRKKWFGGQSFDDLRNIIETALKERENGV